MYWKSILSAITFVLCTNFLLAQEQLAIIGDQEGDVNLREGKGTEFAVVATIKKNELFSCSYSDSEWAEVVFFTLIDCSYHKGYVHRDHIKLVESLPDSALQRLFQDTFLNYGIIGKDFLEKFEAYDQDSKTWTERVDSVEFSVIYNQSSHFHEEWFEPMLSLFDTYFIRTKDTTTLKVLYETLHYHPGSASETPSYVLGACFWAHPELVVIALKEIEPTKQDQGLMHVSNGLYIQCYEKEGTPKCNILREMLDNI